MEFTSGGNHASYSHKCHPEKIRYNVTWRLLIKSSATCVPTYETLCRELELFKNTGIGFCSDL